MGRLQQMTGAVLAAIAILSAIFVLIWTLQRKLIYFPFGDVPSPQAIGLSGATEVTFPTTDGLELRGWFVKQSEAPGPRAQEPRRGPYGADFAPWGGPPWFTVIVFNGNAGNRAFRAPLADALSRRGIAVVLFDYRGFGGNSGLPTEQGLTADSRAVRQYLLGRQYTDPKRLAYFGESLGSAVAADLAAEFPPAALILRSPFTSMTALGQYHYPILPVRWLLRDRFATLDRITRIRCPLLVIAGGRDRIVPATQSRRLYDAANEPKTLLILPDADHNDDELLNGTEMIDGIERFLRTVASVRSVRL
jgi:uncharacterized protein